MGNVLYVFWLPGNAYGERFVYVLVAYGCIWGAFVLVAWECIWGDVFWSPEGAYVGGNAEGKVEGNAGGNAEGNAEGNAGGIFSLTMVSIPARGVMQYIYIYDLEPLMTSYNLEIMVACGRKWSSGVG